MLPAAMLVISILAVTIAVTAGHLGVLFGTHRGVVHVIAVVSIIGVAAVL
jgi:hypothetical protein